MESKKERLKNLIFYILKKLEQVSKVKLAKLILFSEIESIRLCNIREKTIPVMFTIDKNTNFP